MTRPPDKRETIDMKSHIYFTLPLVAILVLLISLTAYALDGEKQQDLWEGDEVISDQAFLEEGRSAVDSDSQGHRSIYIWNRYLFLSDAFQTLSEVFTELKIDRVYQYISLSIFDKEELPDVVSRLSAMGIQTVALMGDTDWLKDSLREYKELIDALYEYNQAHPEEKIPAVALDVEAHTLKSFRRNPAVGFAAYIRCMEEACQYAHKRDLQVIQVISRTLDTIDQEQFEYFLTHCCDEVSIMNYNKDTELDAIWNEVLTCRMLGIPVETIFETKPLSEKYGVTEDRTYYYDGGEALAGAVEEIQKVYGSSLSIGYHHLDTVYHVQTGLDLSYD